TCQICNFNKTTTILTSRISGSDIKTPLCGGYCFMSISENPQKPKFYRVRFFRFGKVHIAREPKDGFYPLLCGLKTPCDRSFAESINFYIGDECLRCQRCTSVK